MKRLILVFISFFASVSLAQDGLVMDTFLGSYRAYVIEPRVVVIKQLVQPAKRLDGTLEGQTAWNVGFTDDNGEPFSLYYRWYLLDKPMEVSEFIPDDIRVVYKYEKKGIFMTISRFGGIDEMINYLKIWQIRNST